MPPRPANFKFQTRPARRAPPAVNNEILKQVAYLAKKSGAMDPRLAAGWKDIVGPEIARICRPLRLKPYGKSLALEVSVPHGAAAMQIQYQLATLQQKVNNFLGFDRVTRVDIVQRGVTAHQNAAGKSLYSRSSSQSPPHRLNRQNLPDPGDPTDLEHQLMRMKKLLALKTEN